MRTSWILMIYMYFGASLAREEWIDPHDMNVNPRGRLKYSTGGNNHLHNNNDGCEKLEFNLDTTTHFKRFVGVILQSSGLKLGEDNLYKGIINIHLTKEEHEFLRQFTNPNPLKAESLRKFNTIIDKAFKKTTFEAASEFIFSFTEEVYFRFFNRATGIFLIASTILYVVYTNKLKWSWKNIFIMISLLIYASDFCLTYLELAEDVEIDNYLNIKEYENEQCSPSKTWWNYFFGPDCKQEYRKYYKSVHKTEMFLVRPAKVISKQTEMCVQVLKYLGQGIGGLVAEIFGSLPWPWNVLLLPLILVFVLGLFAVCLTAYCNNSIRINLLHLFNFEISGNHTGSTPQKDSISGKNVDKIFELLHERKQIENVREDRKEKRKNSKSPKKMVQHQNDQENKKIEQKPKAEPKKEIKAVENKENITKNTDLSFDSSSDFSSDLSSNFSSNLSSNLSL